MSDAANNNNGANDMTKITINAEQMGSEWTEADSIEGFAAALAEVTGYDVAAGDGASEGPEVPEDQWGKAIDTYMSSTGRIGRDWMDGARGNADDETVLGWFAAAGDWSDVDIDAEGSVWVNGRWLTQREINDTCQRIDRGV